VRIPSFQLGTVTLASCRVSVRAINRSTSGFPNPLVFCRKPARLENQTSLPLLASCKGGLLYVLTVYPAESWARAYAPTSFVFVLHFLRTETAGRYFLQEHTVCGFVPVMELPPTVLARLVCSRDISLTTPMWLFFEARQTTRTPLDVALTNRSCHCSNVGIRLTIRHRPDCTKRYAQIRPSLPPPKARRLCFWFGRFGLFVCLSVRRITEKVVNGF